jgi:diaminopimelate decarboxylase
MPDQLLSSKYSITSDNIIKTSSSYGSPVYIYDERTIIEKCRMFLSMPNAFGIRPRYAMKANSGKAILQLIAGQGLYIDASSLNEAVRANNAGISEDKILLTTQEVPEGDERKTLEIFIKNGMKYNVCSLKQLELIKDFASVNSISLSIRIHPGSGSGESATRNTGDKYSCFGVHLSDLEKVLDTAKNNTIIFDSVHVHIGSGGDPEKWSENIDRELGFIEKYFPFAKTVNFGGGFREARMPDEIPANLIELGNYAKKRIEEHFNKTGEKLLMEVEPGTYIMANSGFLVTKIIDIKQTGSDGFSFLILDGGMEVNSRPLLYGSRHPFYLLSKKGELISSEFELDKIKNKKEFVVVGRCCESGDSQTLDQEDHIIPRLMGIPDIGDYIVIGGTGAYCSSMTPFNYNSHTQIPEVLVRTKGKLQLIRKGQTIKQITMNEFDL